VNLLTTDHRVRELQQRMEADDVDACVFLLPENIVLVTGFYVRIPGLGICVVPREGEASLLVPNYDLDRARETWSGDLRDFSAVALAEPATGPLTKSLQGLLGVADGVQAHLTDLSKAYGARGGRIGFEGSFEQVSPAIMIEPNAVGLPTQAMLRQVFATDKLFDMAESIETLRAVKTDYDLERLAVVNEIAAFGLEAFYEAAIPGNTDAEVRSAIESAIGNKGHGYRGARAVRGLATVGSGQHLVTHGWNYQITSARVIEEGDLVMVEMGTVADGYWADNTRTVVAGGTGTELQQEANETVWKAMQAAFAAAVPGALGGDVDAAARAVCQASGLPGVFPHQTGHGVGFRYHEPTPNLVPRGDARLEEGMCLAVEPAFYGPEYAGGIRQEHNAVVRPGGAVAFTQLELAFGATAAVA
jgi:Xaa-Pro dipeptidase